MAEISKITDITGTTYDIKDVTARSAANAKVSKSGDTMDGILTVNSEVHAHCLEFSGMSSGAGHGGFIDFHYNNSSYDHTSRIIECSPGTIRVVGALQVANGIVSESGWIIINSPTVPQLYLRNASDQEMSSIWSGDGRIYLRERPYTGSSYFTDIVFPTAYPNGSGNKYVYTSDNFGLNGTTLYITSPT